MKKELKETNYFMIGAVVFILIIAATYFFPSSNSIAQEKLDQFAACISESGAKFYGAFWCSHCNSQKELFGNSKNLPYIECSTPDGKGQLPICADAGIKGYPAWIFSDGQEASGQLSLDILSGFTGCELKE